MIPKVEQLLAVQNAINAQHPSSPDARGWVNETDCNGLRVLRLTAEQLETVVGALAAATIADLWNYGASPEQTGWAGIIDVALTARGAPPGEMRNEAFMALTRVDVPTLERMAALVLGERRELAPDTPETVAAKARDALEVLRAFRQHVDGEGGE